MYLGIALVALAGAMSGSGVWPLKAVKVFNFDQIYFFAPLFSFLIIPWTVAFIFCPDIMDIVARIPRERMVFFSVMAVFYTVGCYMGWYTAARLGVGIAYGINSCFANITGVMIPILFKGPALCRRYDSAPKQDTLLRHQPMKESLVIYFLAKILIFPVLFIDTPHFL